jgi:peptide/nickel transport system substrate-binding protein
MPRQYNLIAWNSRRPQLADARVRRALTMGLDRETIVEAVVQGYGTVAHTGVAPYHWAYDPSAIDLIPYDPEGARALLDEAGWRDRDGDGVREAADGTPLSISIKYNASQIRQQIAEIAQAQLYQIGVGVQPRMVEYTTLVEQVITPEVRDFDGVVWGWTVGFEIDETEIFHSDRVDEPLALSGTRNAEMDRLTERLRLVSDRDAARRLWTEYQQLVIEEQPYTFLYFPDGLAGINRRVRDVVMDARGEWVNVKDWYLDPDGP